MTSLALVYSDMALFSDVVNTRVVFPRLTSAPHTRDYEEATVRFEGDQQPTPFRGEGRPRSYPLAARYFRAEQQLLADMLALFEAAQDAPDSRLLLRTNLATISDLNAIEVVTVSQVTPTPLGAGHYDLTFTAKTVQFEVTG